MKRSSLYSVQSIKRIQDYPDILTVDEVSELLGVSSKTVYKMLKEGKIEKRQIGRSFTILKSNVTKYLGIEQK